LDGSYVVSNGDFTSKPDDPKPHFSWKNLCMSGGYHDHIMEQVEEICKNYPVDGFFFDIYQIEKLCYCDNCRKGMDEEGVDIYDEEQVAAYNARKMKRHMRDLRNLIEKYHPEATVFFNGTTSLKRRNNFLFGMHEYNTHQELEDLPTTWGGYDKLPLQSKFFLNSGYSVMAMSGKFHTAWGEFGGFKHPNAIKYEAAAMVSYGACCSIGDQLHPAGEMDLATYRNIGVGYEYVEKIEEYGVGGMPVARLGIWRTAVPEHDEGVVKMLLETQNNFNIVDPSQKLESYEVIIIPGVANLDKQQADRLNTFVDNGGKLLVVGEGALNEAKTDFVLDVGATYLGPAEYQIDYLLVNADIQTGVVSSPFLNYEAALRCQPAAGSDILAHIREPYFDRTYEKYCSHQNTPYQLNNAAHPGIIKTGNVIYIAHPIDKLYFEHGAQLHRQVFINALRLLHDTPMVETELPSAGRLAFLHQPDENRYVAHLLYGPPLQRGRCLVIEDLPTLYDIPVRIDSPKKIKRAMMIPSGKILQMTTDKGYTTVNVPEFECHTGVVFEY
jgi:hypothetical protein